MPPDAQPHLVDPLPGCAPEIGRLLWMLGDARRRTEDLLAGLDPAWVDRAPAISAASLGTLLYHVAGVEASWLYEDVLRQPFPPEIDELFPWDLRDAAGRLTAMSGESLSTHRRRLYTVRGRLLAAYREMTVEEFHRVRRGPEHSLTPEWVLHHLLQHEAEHRGEMRLIISRWS